jgi:enamine deaminase RidA (YjgF/YER057c/UK114 family)
MKMPGISSYALLQQIENALKRAKYICQGINILLKCIISA